MKMLSQDYELRTSWSTSRASTPIPVRRVFNGSWVRGFIVRHNSGLMVQGDKLYRQLLNGQ